MQLDTTTRIPVVLAIDVEPDEFFVDRDKPRPWSGFEFSHGYLKEMRARFEQVSGRPVHFYWSLRMDPQVATAYGSATWVADRYADMLEECRSAGDELGIHVHTYRWSETLEGWLDDCGNAEWVMECLESSFDAFRRVFGEPARTLRFGNYWLSTAAVNRAEELGIEYDLTIEPGLPSKMKYGNKPPQSGPTPDFYRVPRRPYYPSRSEFRRPVKAGRDRKIVMMPLTSAYQELGWRPAAWRHRIGRLRRNGLRGRLQNLPLSMWRARDDHNPFSALLDRALSLQSHPYLAFAIRSDINGKDFPAYDSALNALSTHGAAARFSFCTPKEALAHLPLL